MHVCRDRYTQKNLNDVLKRIILSKSKTKCHDLTRNMHMMILC